MLTEPLGYGVSIKLFASSVWQRRMTSTKGFKVGEKGTKVEEKDRHRQSSKSGIELNQSTSNAPDRQVARAKRGTW